MLHFGSEMKVTTPDGREWTLGRLRVRQVLAFRDWVAQRVGDPFATVERFIDKLPREESIRLIKEAENVKLQLECWDLFGPLSLQWLNTPEGVFEFTRLWLRESHPDATPDEIEDVAIAVVQRGLAEVIATTGGSLPNVQAAGEVPPPAEPTGTPSTSAPGTATATAEVAALTGAPSAS